MLLIKATLPTTKLKINRVLSKLFQSYVYAHIDDKEHDGYTHKSGKKFKAMNFSIVYEKNEILIKYTALNKDNEKDVAMAILSEGLKLGEIDIVNCEVSLKKRDKDLDDKIKVAGYIAAAIKDGNSNKKIYLEPKSQKFQQIIKNHTLQKYETLFGTPYEKELKIKVLKQYKHPKTFFYNKGVMKSWHGIYEIEADKKMLGLILDTGIGAHAMQGVGFVEVV